MRRIYVLTRLEMNESNPSVKTDVFLSLPNAEAQFNKEIASVKAENLQDIYDDLVVEFDHSSYHCYRDGRATELSIEINIIEQTLED